MATNKVTVVAPSTLDAGYTFEAQVDGKNFTVTVPEGGVTEGQTFQVDYPTGDASKPTTTAPTPGNAASTGRWRYDLCDCCSTCLCPFWMAWCCPGVLLGQVMQRMKLNFIGQSTGDYSNTCKIASAASLVMFVLIVVLGGAAGYVGVVVYYVIFIYLIVAGTLTRMYFRKKYSIEPSCCGDSALDDCCCIYWCFCCSAIQMHRQTHDENVHKYDISSETGLASDAPEIV